MQGGYHPEHDGFIGGQVKQADTVMLSFPLGMDMASQSTIIPPRARAAAKPRRCQVQSTYRI